MRRVSKTKTTCTFLEYTRRWTYSALLYSFFTKYLFFSSESLADEVESVIMRGYAQQIKERNSRIGENCEKFKQPFRTYSEDQIMHIGLWYFTT